MVKSLVQLRHGTVDIKSQVGTGTQVTVRLPLRKATMDLAYSQQGQATIPSEIDHLVGAVRECQNSKDFVLFGFTDDTGNMVRESLHQYLTKWVNMRSASDGMEPAIVITDEACLAECLSSLSNYHQRPKLIVVCDNNIYSDTKHGQTSQ
jgi:hypothetical protein